MQHGCVPLEGEAGVRFRPGALDLRVAAEGEDVVADDILLAIVLVDPAVGGAIDG